MNRNVGNVTRLLNLLPRQITVFVRLSVVRLWRRKECLTLDGNLVAFLVTLYELMVVASTGGRLALLLLKHWVLFSLQHCEIFLCQDVKPPEAFEAHEFFRVDPVISDCQKRPPNADDINCFDHLRVKELLVVLDVKIRVDLHMKADQIF